MNEHLPLDPAAFPAQIPASQPASGEASPVSTPPTAAAMPVGEAGASTPVEDAVESTPIAPAGGGDERIVAAPPVGSSGEPEAPVSGTEADATPQALGSDEKPPVRVSVYRRMTPKQGAAPCASEASEAPQSPSEGDADGETPAAACSQSPADLSPRGPAYPSAAAREAGRKHRRPLWRSLGLVAAALLLTVTVSLTSVTCYIWYLEKNGVSLPQTSPVFDPDDSIFNVTGGGERMSVSAVYQRALPWVVSFTCESPSEGLPRGKTGVSVSYGTGVILTSDGYVLTNAHVVEGADRIRVTTHGGTRYDATVVGSDESTDIAVVKIDASGLSAAEFGDSTRVLVGQTAIVIGNPLGTNLAETLTVGVISATERTVTLNSTIMTLIQTDASVSPGNSGGPLLNSQGQIVGIINSKVSEDDVEGIGFAIPANTALSVAQDFMDYGYIASRPMLGITVQSMDQETADYYKETYGEEYAVGITVTEVSPGSCAETGGVQVGDKILAFNGTAVNNAGELNYLKEKCQVGDTVILTVERAEVSLNLTIVLTAKTR